MKTSKSFMLTTYELNIDFIKMALDNLIKQEIISFYAFVIHNASNEVNKHIHVFIYPCKEIEVFDVLGVIKAFGYKSCEWYNLCRYIDSYDDILCINIPSKYSHYLEV